MQRTYARKPFVNVAKRKEDEEEDEEEEKTRNMQEVHLADG